MAFQAAGDKAAAMEINQGGQRSYRRDRRIRAGAQGAARTGNGKIFHFAHGNIRGSRQLHHAGKALARHGGRQVPDLGPRNLRRPVEKGFHQWIERHESRAKSARDANAFGGTLAPSYRNTGRSRGWSPCSPPRRSAPPKGGAAGRATARVEPREPGRSPRPNEAGGVNE